MRNNQSKRVAAWAGARLHNRSSNTWQQQQQQQQQRHVR
jgi:hypothetical protein